MPSSRRRCVPQRLLSDKAVEGAVVVAVIEVAVEAAVDDSGRGCACRPVHHSLPAANSQSYRPSAGETLAGELLPDRRATPWPSARQQGRD